MSGAAAIVRAVFFPPLLAAAAACSQGAAPGRPEATAEHARRVAIGPDGYFYVDGRKTIVFGAEEEHHRYTAAELGSLIPRLREMGVTFLVLYVGNPQDDFFYARLDAAGIFVAQDLGNVKKRMVSPFAATGGVIGTLPDEALVAANLAQIDDVVGRLARFDNILFWWMGGELAEPEFHSAAGRDLTRDSIRRYAQEIRALDPERRPFTVSHHYVEAIEDPALPFVDYSDLTDFTWFTLATHFHAGDFTTAAPALRWFPVAATSEPSPILGALVRRAYELGHDRPIFLGGWYGQAPLLGPCRSEDQPRLLRDKWDAISGVPHVGGSTYHLSAWDDNAIPHALFEQVDGDWIPTPAGAALGEIIDSSGSPP